MFSPVVILMDPSGQPAILEFHHQIAPTFRALLVFSCPGDAMKWLAEQPQRAAPAWVGYAPAVVRTLAPIEERFYQTYGHGMSIINMSSIMRMERTVG